MSDIAWLRSEFDRCWHWMAAAVAKYGPTHNREHVWQALETGHAQLWPTPNAVMVTCIETHPTGFKELKGWLSGGNLQEIQNTIPVIEAYARKMGCDRAVICGRKGWVRSLDGYRDIASIIVKEL